MPAERFEFEDFELDRSAYELRHAGSVVHLERIPLELLFLLVQRRGQLVTRQEIFERIWGKDVFLDTDNSINTAVRKLRHALQDDPDAPHFVVTVPAKGYRFIAPIREDSSAIPLPEASPVSAVAEASPTADVADASPMMTTKVDMPLRKNRRRGILWSIGGIALVIAVIVLIQQVSLRPPTTTASIPTTQSPALPLPDKPSIAVLPFTYKGKAVNVQQVGRELGVQYVLEGSVRKADNQVRVTAQLADATTGDHLWAERYDRPLQDIFAVQDSIVQRIVTTLNLEFTLVHQGWQFQRHTDSPEAYDDALRGIDYELTPTKERNLKARQMFEKAIELDPKYSHSYTNLGYTYWLDWVQQWSDDPRALDRAFELEQQAIALDDSQFGAHTLLSNIYLFKKQYDQATAEAERVLALANSAAGYSALAQIMDCSGKPAEAIGLAEKAMRLDPLNREGYLYYEGWSYTQMGRYEE